MANRRFTSLEPGVHTSGLLALLDVSKETLHLARVRSRYFLVLLLTFLLVLLLKQGSTDYIFHPARTVAYSEETRIDCNQNILFPWLRAAATKNLSASQQEEFYKLSQLNCSLFTLPVGASGSYKFINGSMEIHSFGYSARPRVEVAHGFTFLVLELLASLWSIWTLVAVAWGLQVATATAPSSNTRPIAHTVTQKVSLTDLIQEIFSANVLGGFLRVLLTMTLVWTMATVTDYLGARLRRLAVNGSADLIQVSSPVTSRGWALANPLLLVFMLSSAVAALEPGMSGFKALWRGVQLTKGKLWATLLIHLMLSLWKWLCMYLTTAILIKPAVADDPLWKLSLRSIGTASLNTVTDLPGLFLLPVFYFFCKSWRENLKTMA